MKKVYTFLNTENPLVLMLFTTKMNLNTLKLFERVATIQQSTSLSESF